MKKKIFVLLTLLIAIVGFNVKAEDQFYADDSVYLEKDVKKTAFVAGNNVDLSSKIDGVGFVAGNSVNITSSQDYLFAAGNIITVAEASAKDAFIAGNMVKINSSQIRDLYVAAQSVTINSDITGDAYITAETIVINGNISGNLELAAENITITSNSIISGTLKYPEEINVDIQEGSQINKTETYVVKNENKRANLVKNLVDQARSYVSILLVAIIMLAIFKNMFKNIESMPKETKDIVRVSVKGVIFLLVVPVISLFIFITVVGIPLSLLMLCGYISLIYLAAIPATYYYGKLAFKDNIKNEYLLLTVSLLIFFVIKTIPALGPLVNALTIFTGLGIYTMLLTGNVKSKKKEAKEKK